MAVGAYGDEWSDRSDGQLGGRPWFGVTVRSGEADGVSVGRVTCDRAEQGSAIDGIGRT